VKRWHYILTFFCVCFTYLGCQSKAFQMLIEPQEWENLATAEGVTCNVPEMIDGDLKTVGYANSRWLHVTLPVRKTIHRIVIRGTNITDAVVYKQLEGDGRWQGFMELKNNRGPDIEMKMSTVTQALRIYVSGTTDDKRKAPQFSFQQGSGLSRKELGRPFAKELEVYGFKSKDKK